jgi:hypothetical protein
MQIGPDVPLAADALGIVVQRKGLAAQAQVAVQLIAAISAQSAGGDSATISPEAQALLAAESAASEGSSEA